MSKVKEQLAHIEDLRSAQYITSTLRDISAIELKRVRDNFELNGRFTDELRDLYQLVWSLGERAGKMMNEEKYKQKLYVAYTTNKHFYGALNHDVMQKFMSETSADDRCLIIGDTGKEIWHAGAKKRREVSFMSFADDSPDAEETGEFIKRAGGYGRVFVYYPCFISVFLQEPRVLDVTFRPKKRKKAIEGTGDVEARELAEYEFLLEPDLSEIIGFFNTQVRQVLFERMLLETQLARVSARLVKMDTADQNAESIIGREVKELRRATASFSSRRMIETVVGYLQWHTQKI